MLQISPGMTRSLTVRIPFYKRGPVAIVALIGCIVAAFTLAACVWIVSQRPEPAVVRFGIKSSTPPLPKPLEEGFIPMDRAKAELVNAGIAVANAPIEQARPFAIAAADIISRQSAADCLTAAIYYEAASESDRGQRAVAQVVLNRVRHPAFPKSVCGVVYQGAERRTGCQFSFTCDGSLARKPTQAAWARARGIALAALAGFVEPSVGTATHYHTIWVVPYWAWSLDKITTLDAHIFYRWRGFWGRRAAFAGVYTGESEPEQAVIMTDVPLDMPGGPVLTGTKPIGTRLLADELQHLSPGTQLAAEPARAPRADQERGRLAADESAGALIGAAPSPASATTNSLPSVERQKLSATHLSQNTASE